MILSLIFSDNFFFCLLIVEERPQKIANYNTQKHTRAKVHSHCRLINDKRLSMVARADCPQRERALRSTEKYLSTYKQATADLIDIKKFEIKTIVANLTGFDLKLI